MINTIVIGLSDEELTTAYFQRKKDKPEKMEALADQFSDMESRYDEDSERGNHGSPF